jgi:hypothetical protein
VKLLLTGDVGEVGELRSVVCNAGWSLKHKKACRKTGRLDRDVLRKAY